MKRRIYEKPVLVKRDLLPLAAAGGTAVVSDRRLKTDIVRVGQLRAGVPLYRFRYFWSDDVFVGVMAQDVLAVVPEAVATDASGFMRVDYARLGTRMIGLAEWEAGDLAEQEARSAVRRDRDENQEARSAVRRDRDENQEARSAVRRDRDEKRAA